MRFLEFLDVRGDERVALKLKKERQNKSPPAVPALPSPEILPTGSTSPPNVMSMFANSSEKNISNSSTEQRNNASTPSQPNTDNSRSAPIVIVALSYRKSA